MIQNDPCRADLRFMDMALALARRGLGNTWPNPAVGAVIVKDGRVLGRGWTAPKGRPHAESQALAQAGSAAKGATIYVTLEPCSHQGKTPPCAEAIIKAGIKRVVCASDDPNPQVNGKGFATLQGAGLKVQRNLRKVAGDTINRGFFLNITQNRPMITLKLALSLDGKIATKTGDSQWITGAKARHYVHYLRSTHDAVMVGRGTMLADDPNLNIRGFGKATRQPVRVVMDTHLKSPADSALGRAAKNGDAVWLCHGAHANTTAWTMLGADTIGCEMIENQVSISDALKQLAQRGLTRVFCEGGGRLAASLLRAGLVDELFTFQGGIAIGADGLDGLGAFDIPILAHCPRFELQSHCQFGNDTLSHWTMQRAF